MSTWNYADHRQVEHEKMRLLKVLTALPALEGAADLAAAVFAQDAGEPVAAHQAWVTGEGTRIGRSHAHVPPR